MWVVIDKVLAILKHKFNFSSVVGFDFEISLWTICLFCIVLGIGFSIFRKVYD